MKYKPEIFEIVFRETCIALLYGGELMLDRNFETQGEKKIYEKVQ